MHKSYFWQHVSGNIFLALKARIIASTQSACLCYTRDGACKPMCLIILASIVQVDEGYWPEMC
jgi:hypothetical protein